MSHLLKLYRLFMRVRITIIIHHCEKRLRILWFIGWSVITLFDNTRHSVRMQFIPDMLATIFNFHCDISKTSYISNIQISDSDADSFNCLIQAQPLSIHTIRYLPRDVFCANASKIFAGSYLIPQVPDTTHVRQHDAVCRRTPNMGRKSDGTFRLANDRQSLRKMDA